MKLGFFYIFLGYSFLGYSSYSIEITPGDHTPILQKKIKVINKTLDFSLHEINNSQLYSKAYQDYLHKEEQHCFNPDFFDNQVVNKAYPGMVKTRIKHIDLRDCNITKLPIDHFIKCFPFLKTINVAGCPIEEGVMEADTRAYYCYISDYITTILKKAPICDSSDVHNALLQGLLLWNGRGCLAQNDRKKLYKPLQLKVIYNNKNKEYFEKVRQLVPKSRVLFINQDVTEKDYIQDDIRLLLKTYIYTTFYRIKGYINQLLLIYRYKKKPFRPTKDTLFQTISCWRKIYF